MKYTAIESGFALACSGSDLLELHWRNNGIVADFIDPENDDRLWRVVFDDVDFIRVLDEFYLSTEEHPLDKEGLVPQNFAYLVEGSRFYRSQSDMLPTTLPKARHYRFVTGWTCLDVISMLEPKFEISAKSSRSVDTA
ncbi:hypothetical protein [Mesorhizobium sp. KR9-304]|uniref:hypothetical protein n=1 Tax=Mesorhizobium sp. KR9-304 TaxID=3156614 RepID=UPI0032B35958